VESQEDQPLRIALFSTCAVATPPKRYGGTELVVAELAGALRKLGHAPSVFATGDSTCVGARRCLFDEPIWPPDDLAELRHSSAGWAEIASCSAFDVVHVNHAAALPFTRIVRMPTVATVHHSRVDELTRHYAAHPGVAFAAISRRQAELAWEIPFRAIVHHGLDVDRYAYGAGGRGCAFLGRLAAVKAPHLAIDAARRAGVPIYLGGDAHPSERAYFESTVRPLFGEGVVHLGEVDHAAKLDLLGSVCCMLFPIEWEEPFGLVMIESMLVGTPVIAFARGAATEVIEEGVTGFLVKDVEEMTARIRDVGRIDRRSCRAAARGRWNAERMAREYVSLYRATIRRARWGMADGAVSRRAVHAGSGSRAR
jgi:glycosyltransferase involved in cell wall biosynthesis